MENNQKINDVLNSILNNVNTCVQSEKVDMSVNQSVNALAETSKYMKDDIDRVKAQIDALEKKKPLSEPNIYLLLVAILLGAIIFFGLAILAYKQWDIGLSGDSIVLAFVGILATFVVVSNYLQLKRTDDKVDSFKSEIDALNYRVSQLEGIDKNRIKAMNSEYEGFKREVFLDLLFKALNNGCDDAKGFLEKNTEYATRAYGISDSVFLNGLELLLPIYKASGGYSKNIAQGEKDIMNKEATERHRKIIKDLIDEAKSECQSFERNAIF